MDKSAAISFAVRSETDELEPVLLEIRMDNKSGRHYFSLDTRDYSNYPDEREILIQAGIKFKFIEKVVK